MDTEQNKAVVRRFYEAFTADDEAALREVLAPDLVAYSHGAPGPQPRDVHVQGIRGWNASFETHFTVDEQIAEGSTIATIVTMRAVHNRGPFQGIAPTGKTAELTSATVERVEGGKIVERRVYSDFQWLMQELGLAPAAASAG